MVFQPRHIQVNSPEYPPSLTLYLADRAPHTIAAMGNIAILDSKPVAVFSSATCPGPRSAYKFNP